MKFWKCRLFPVYFRKTETTYNTFTTHTHIHAYACLLEFSTEFQKNLHLYNSCWIAALRRKTDQRFVRESYLLLWWCCRNLLLFGHFRNKIISFPTEIWLWISNVYHHVMHNYTGQTVQTLIENWNIKIGISNDRLRMFTSVAMFVAKLLV